MFGRPLYIYGSSCRSLEDCVALDREGSNKGECKRKALVSTHNRFEDTVKALLGAGADVNFQCDAVQETALIAAVKNDAEDIVELLKEAIDVDDHNAFYQTPLYIALQHGHTGQWLSIKVPWGMKDEEKKMKVKSFQY